MNYQDFVYGQAGNDEPVLVELISTAAMQWHKDILERGITGFWDITRLTTRLEHSVKAIYVGPSHQSTAD